METVKIKRLSGFTTIPKSKYNAAKHDLYIEPPKPIKPVVIQPSKVFPKVSKKRGFRK